MDKYLKQPERQKDHAANVSTSDRAKQYKKSEVFEDGGRLFCRSCNVVLNHQRKSVVDNHFKSAVHVRHAELPDAKKQKTINTLLHCRTRELLQ